MPCFEASSVRLPEFFESFGLLNNYGGLVEFDYELLLSLGWFLIKQLVLLASSCFLTKVKVLFPYTKVRLYQPVALNYR